ncbi:MAG: hypothetical protein AAF850_00865 [Pseudomonadota bacterium]
MPRIILPIAVIAALLFLPIFSETTIGSVTGEETTFRTGNYFVGNTVGCFIEQNPSIDGECAPKGGTKGMAIFGAVFISAVAAVLGVLGLLPFIGRLTSIVTTLAGIAVIAAVAYFALTIMGADEGAGAVQYGSYIAGGGGLLTLISGLSGMRGR